MKNRPLLKDCPHCGSVELEVHRSRHGMHYVVCPSCWTKSVPCSTVKAAVRLWNHRTGNTSKNFEIPNEF